MSRLNARDVPRSRTWKQQLLVHAAPVVGGSKDTNHFRVGIFVYISVQRQRTESCFMDTDLQLFGSDKAVIPSLKLAAASAAAQAAANTTTTRIASFAARRHLAHQVPNRN